MDWRTWLYARLDAPELTAIVPRGSHFGAGSIDENVEPRPFIVIKAGAELRGPFPGVSENFATIWVHDEPGSYTRIDDALKVIRAVLEGAVTDLGGVACRWQGDSAELADEFFGTITRNTSYRLNGKDGAA